MTHPHGWGRGEVHVRCAGAPARLTLPLGLRTEEMPMAWTTPTLVEICIGLEINGYLPAEF
jgi:coenzyme PQQ precursor peptide PqqA